MFLTIITFIIILTALVLVHELGHFYTAKRSGVKVEEFGLGIPPRMVGIRKNKDGNRELIWGGKYDSAESETTIYSLNWLPFGGFVKLKGEDGVNADDSDALAAQSAGKRSLVLSAGVIMNIVFAAVLLIVVFAHGFPTILDESIDPKYVSDKQLQIAEVLVDSPAASAGLLPGDVITTIDGNHFENVEAMREYLATINDQSVTVVGEHVEGVAFTQEVTPAYIEPIDQTGIGFAIVETGTVKYPWYRAFDKGIASAFYMTKEILKAFGNIISSLITTGSSGQQLAGPVGIAVLTGKVVQKGFVDVLHFAAVLSINLAIINILPFPALDGGRLLFIAIEKARGRAVSQKIETTIHTVGFTLLILLIIVITIKDIGTFGTQIWNAITGLFA